MPFTASAQGVPCNRIYCSLLGLLGAALARPMRGNHDAALLKRQHAVRSMAAYILECLQWCLMQHPSCC